jgi:predicted nucleic acid-binding Zn finger protein
VIRKADAGRIERIVNLGAVKLHIFQPSGRKIWTVVGKDDEHWTDPDLEFCSCKNYYYKTLSNGEACYHLKSIQYASEKNKFVSIKFDDAEYIDFIKALLMDNVKKLLCG